MSKKSDVADAGGGRPRVSFTKDAAIRMDWPCGAKNVQIKLPTRLVRNGGWLCGIEKDRQSLRWCGNVN